MNTQPQALLLADWIKNTEFYENTDPFINEKMSRAEAELRRLHEVTQELSEALNWIVKVNATDYEYQQRAKAALMRAGHTT